MGDIAIRIEGLGKKYQIGARQEQYPTLRNALASGFKRMISKPFGTHAENNSLWALKDISFEVKKGEVLGIIGRNGAGKSTLLKVLAHITEPTKGRVSLYGRVGSLLEVGTGFHPELTGRDNIYLNGAILGMKRAEIQRKFDEIVAFSEIEKFLDTPVKRYSSGMYVRLAFAVAAHLEPEILIVDEVLAVGDVEFQKKCTGKMGEVAKEGRTVLLVSHNMGVVRNLAGRCILLNTGCLILDSTTEEAISNYLYTNVIGKGSWRREGAKENTQAYFFGISVNGESDSGGGNIDSSKGFCVVLELTVLKKIHNCQVHIRVINQEGNPIFTSASTDKVSTGTLHPGTHKFIVSVPGNLLKPGRYFLTSAILNPNIEIFDLVEGIGFMIDDIGNHSTVLNDGRLGIIAPLLEWREMSDN